jgi:hypothetical protein
MFVSSRVGRPAAAPGPSIVQRADRAPRSLNRSGGAGPGIADDPETPILQRRTLAGA